MDAHAWHWHKLVVVMTKLVAFRQRTIAKEQMQCMNAILPRLLKICEEAVGVQRLRKRETPLLMVFDAPLRGRYYVESKENALLDVLNFKDIRDAQLLSLSFLRNDEQGARVL